MKYQFIALSIAEIETVMLVLKSLNKVKDAVRRFILPSSLNIGLEYESII